MLSLSASTTDDRGRRVTVFTPTSQPRARYDSDPQLREIVQRIAGSMKIGLSESMSRTHFGNLLPFALIPTAVIMGTMLVPTLSPWAKMAISVIAMVGMMPVGFALHHRQIAARLRATLLREGRCPSCAYPINSLAAEPDGCITCPECSAAWRAAEVGAPVQAGIAPAVAAPPISGRAAVPDARDRAVSLRHPLLLDLDHQRVAELETDRLVRLRLAVRRRTRRAKLIGIFGGLLAWIFTGGAQLLLVVVAPAGPMPFGIGQPNPIFVLMALFFTAACGIFIYRVLTYRSRTTAVPAARVLIADRLCPSCAGGLAPDPAEPALLLCSTCRAAWKPDGP